MSVEDWHQMIKDIENRQEQLSDWEMQFVDNIDNRLGRGYSLTPTQSDKLEEIWDRLTTTRR